MAKHNTPICHSLTCLWTGWSALAAGFSDSGLAAQGTGGSSPYKRPIIDGLCKPLVVPQLHDILQPPAPSQILPQAFSPTLRLGNSQKVLHCMHTVPRLMSMLPTMLMAAPITHVAAAMAAEAEYKTEAEPVEPACHCRLPAASGRLC